MPTEIWAASVFINTRVESAQEIAKMRGGVLQLLLFPQHIEMITVSSVTIHCTITATVLQNSVHLTEVNIITVLKITGFLVYN